MKKGGHINPEIKRRRQVHPYGIQLRLTGHGNWAWIKPNGQPTRKPLEAATWSGPDGEQSALEAAKFLSSRNPGHTFRTKRF